MASPGIFLDRDGVLNENREDHVKSWEEFRFLPGVLTAMRLLASVGVPVVVVTNQAIINRGIAALETVDLIHGRMEDQIKSTGGRLDRVLFCPHAPEDNCDCRKPQPGLLKRAANWLDIDLARSVFVGDALTDVKAGQRAGCQTVLVRTGRGNDAIAKLSQVGGPWPDRMARDLLTAIPAIFELLRLDESRTAAQLLGLQVYKHEELARLQVAAHLTDAAFGTQG